MKGIQSFLGISIILLSACSAPNQDDELRLCEEQGIVLRRDYSKWLCGGGWFLETEHGDTVSLYFANSRRDELESLSLPATVRYTLVELPEDEACREFSYDLACLEVISD